MEQARITGASLPTNQIDDGLRRWYEACPCCMSQAYPDVKQALDEEHAHHRHHESGSAG